MRRSAAEVIRNLESRIARLEKSAGKVMVSPRRWDEQARQLKPSGKREWMDINEVLRLAKKIEWEYDTYNNVIQITMDGDGDDYILVDVEDVLNELLP